LAPGLQAQRYAVGILQPHVAFAVLAQSPSGTSLPINALKILKTAKVVHASGGVELRYPKPADPQAPQLERVAPAAEVQRTSTDSTAADERHLHLVNADAARRMRRPRTLGECADRQDAVQHDKP